MHLWWVESSLDPFDSETRCSETWHVEAWYWDIACCIDLRVPGSVDKVSSWMSFADVAYSRMQDYYTWSRLRIRVVRRMGNMVVVVVVAVAVTVVAVAAAEDMLTCPVTAGLHFD